jgi:hypothetical protein
LSGPIQCGIALSLFAIGWTMASKYAIFNGQGAASLCFAGPIQDKSRKLTSY